MGLGGLAQRTQQTAVDIAEALSVAAPPPQPGAPPMGAQPPSQPGLPPPTSGLAVQPPPRDPGATMLGTMADFRSPPLAAALQGARGAQGPTGL